MIPLANLYPAFPHKRLYGRRTVTERFILLLHVYPALRVLHFGSTGPSKSVFDDLHGTTSTFEEILPRNLPQWCKPTPSLPTLFYASPPCRDASMTPQSSRLLTSNTVNT